MIIKESENKVVKYHKDIINDKIVKFKYKKSLSANQRALFQLVLFDIQNKKIVDISWSDIQKQLKIKKNMTPLEKKKFVEDLSEVKIWVTNGQGESSLITIFPKITIDNKSNKLIVEVQEDGRQLFKLPENNYFLTKIDDINKFTNKYSINIYQLLMRYAYTNDRNTQYKKFNILELLDWLDIPKNSYYRKNWNKFKIEVINKVVKDINKTDSINISKVYKVRKQEKIVFEFSIKTVGQFKKERQKEYIKVGLNNTINKVFDNENILTDKEMEKEVHNQHNDAINALYSSNLNLDLEYQKKYGNIIKEDNLNVEEEFNYEKYDRGENIDAQESIELLLEDYEKQIEIEVMENTVKHITNQINTMIKQLKKTENKEIKNLIMELLKDSKSEIEELNKEILDLKTKKIR